MRDPERNTAAQESGKDRTKHRTRLRTAAAILGVAVGLAAIVLLLVSVWRNQDATMKQLEKEKEERQQELTAKQLREDSLREQISAIGSVQFLLRYLRENHGLALPGDIRIDLSDPNAPVPTPVPSVTPTPEPTQTEEPEPTDEPAETNEPVETDEPAGNE